MEPVDAAKGTPPKPKMGQIPRKNGGSRSGPTLKEREFAKYYLGEAKGNAAKAAELAGYKAQRPRDRPGPDYRRSGYETLHKPAVKKMIEAEVNKLQLKTEDVLEKLSKIAASEWDQFVKVRVNGKGEVIEAKIELRDVVRSLELLGKFHKLFEARDGAISLVQFRQMVAQMGAAVVDVVNELSLDEETSNRLLESVEQRWKALSSGGLGSGGTAAKT